MSDYQPQSGEEISRFRAVVVAALRAKQLRRGSKPRIELDHKKHKDTIIAMEEVRRGLVNFTVRSASPFPPAVMGELQASVEQSVPVG